MKNSEHRLTGEKTCCFNHVNTLWALENLQDHYSCFLNFNLNGKMEDITEEQEL